MTDTHLYNTLFNIPDPADTTDISMDIINQMHGHLDFTQLSKYYDIASYNNLLKDSSNNLNIMHMNARSIPKNFDQITAFLNCLNTFPHVLAITETWLTDNNKLFHQLDGYHSYHLTRDQRAQGGVSIYLANALQTEQIHELTIINEHIEIVTVIITSQSINYVVCAIYRPKSKHDAVNEFSDILVSLLQKEVLKNSKIIIIGDLNINLLEHTTHAPTNNFITSLQTINFFPHISRPTRFPDSSQLGVPSLLDHVYTNFINNFTSGIIHYPISDHLPIFLNLTTSTQIQRLHKIVFRNMSQLNKQQFSHKISAINWNDLLSSESLDINFDNFLLKINEIFNSCFPIQTKYVTEKRLSKPWISQALLTSIKTKNNMYRDFKTGIIPEHKYKEYRNRLTGIIKQVKQDYYISIFTNFKNDTRKVWNTINQLKNNKKRVYLNHITQNNRKLTNPNEIADVFNDYYTNIAPKLDTSLPPSPIDPVRFLHGDYPNSMSVPPVCPQQVTEVIDSLKNKKGNIQEIPVSLIKNNKEIFAIPISLLYNQSISIGTFPTCLKHAIVIPIYKKGKTDSVENYRPISLLSVYSKMFEKLMKKSLFKYLEINNILCREQYGFRKGLNTFHPLNLFTEHIYTNLDSQNSLLSVYIDFTKAFDTVKHDILLTKLHHYGIRGVVYDWFKDYLTNRTQSVRIQNEESVSKQISYGVPQGSVLGPLLFLIYINDLPGIFTKLNSILFADDSTFYIHGKDPNSLIQTANAELNIFHDWSLSNRLTINLNKTYYMIFTNKPALLLPPLLFRNNEIHKTDQHKFLGVTFDDKMTFKYHITDLCLKVSRIISLLHITKDLLPPYVLNILYYAHVLPHLMYCTPIWANTYPTHLLPLFILQKKVIRAITNSNYFAHTQPLFKQTKILKLFDINKLQIAIYMYKKTQQNDDINEPLHNYPTRTRQNLRIPAHTLTIFKHSLSYTGPTLWNNIPAYIKASSSVNTFKNLFKKHILDQY